MSTCPIYQKRGDQLVPVLVIDEAPSSDPSAAGHLVDSNGIASVVQELREEISELQPDVPTIVESVDSITEEDHDGFYWAFDETGAHRVPESNANFPVGSIVYTAMKAAPHGFLICDGSEVGRTTYPDLFTAIGTTYGAGDGTTTFNLPNLMNKTVWGGDLSAVGGEKAAGLPNITGGISGTGTYGLFDGSISERSALRPSYWSYGSGESKLVHPLTENSSVVWGPDSTAEKERFNDADLDASRSNSIYGNSDTVQPPALVLLPCIKAFEAVVNGGMVDVGELIKSIDALKDVAGGSSNEITNIVQNLGNYLPLAGGKMTGTIVTPARVPGTDSPVAMTVRKSTDELLLSTKPTEEENTTAGAFLALHAVNAKTADQNDTLYGAFDLHAASSVGSVSLIGTPGGALQWGGQDVLRAVSVGGSYVRYSDGTQICWGSSSTTANKDTTVAFPIAFAQTPYVVIGRSSEASTTSVYDVWQRAATASNFKVFSNGNTGTRWVALGRWY